MFIFPSLFKGKQLSYMLEYQHYKQSFPACTATKDVFALQMIFMENEIYVQMCSDMFQLKVTQI